MILSLQGLNITPPFFQNSSIIFHQLYADCPDVLSSSSFNLRIILFENIIVFEVDTSMAKHTKVMRYRIIKPKEDSWDVFGKVLRELQRETRTALNKTIQLCWEWQGFSAEYKEQHGVAPKKKDVLGYTNLQGYAYNRIKDEFNTIGSGNLAQTVKRAADKWNSDVKEILRGDRSIPSFKKDVPIDVVASNVRSIRKEGKDYYLRLSLISKECAKEMGRKDGIFEVLIDVRDKTQRVILDRLIEKEYKLGASQILYHKRKWFINLNYQFEKQEEPLDPNRIMGIDMGIVHPLYIAISDSPARYHIEGGEIERFRRQVERRRKQLLKQGKYCGDGRRGHGRQTRIQPIEVLSEKIANFRKTTNHKYARHVIDLALRHKCGTIQLEDLKGIAKDDAFLKNWTYHDLQEKITYKANEAGIQVIKVQPKYTSQRCSECGHISSENRPSQSEFRCRVCGYEALADYNAARNLATKDIEQIIENSTAKK
ncbi:RNA-guided endonuclease InsQ/TnpB family protein [Laceyella putida]|uniref:RNA-guided endonuclease InsQ/TnpB family protein n=1 Tax=Laceyella putida TaxID=110101 RepID=A0ABW2RF50_9BACL